jgi:hypothetical protein
MVMESLRISRDADDEWMLALATQHMGHIAYAAGEPARALECFTRTLEHYRRLREPWGMALSLTWSARCDLALGNIEQARVAATQSLVTPGAVPDPMAFEVFAGVAAADGDYERAIRLHGAAAGVPSSEPRMTGDLAAQAWVSDARRVLEDEVVRHAWQQGHEMSRSEAVDYALALKEASPPASAVGRRGVPG